MEKPKEITSEEISEFVKSVPWANRGDEQQKEWEIELHNKFGWNEQFGKNSGAEKAVRQFIQELLDKQKDEVEQFERKKALSEWCRNREEWRIKNEQALAQQREEFTEWAKKNNVVHGFNDVVYVEDLIN